MNTGRETPLIVRTQVSAWGFVVALAMALAFLLAGWNLLQSNIMPNRLGVFVEPPPWLPGVLMLAFSAFLFLVGISELARYVRPATELVLDNDGVTTFGLLGRRHTAWPDILSADLAPSGLALKVRGKGRVPPPDLNIYFSRLDIDPSTILDHISARRPDLVAPG